MITVTSQNINGYWYRGWRINGHNGHWTANRNGVSMNIKSDDMTKIKQMIDNHENDHAQFVKNRNDGLHFPVTNF